MLVERTAETEAIAAAIASAAAGMGQALAIVGPAGSGKSALLELAARRAGAALVRRAAPMRGADELELVRALLERPLHEIGVPLGDLYWGCHALALRQWLALLVDDAQCADDASLAALGRLAARAHDLPLLLVVAGRRLPGVRVLDLQPLSAAGSARIVRRLRAGATADQCARWHRRAGGNPWLVAELARRGDRGGLSAAGRADLRRRLGRLSAPELRAARALAVLGERERVHLAAVAGVAPGALATIYDRLAAEGLRHPLLVAAVREEMPAGERDRLHRAAAAALRDAGEPDADHLLRCAPAGDPAVVGRLREAAAAASPCRAVVYLERALTEGVDRRESALRLADAMFHAGLPGAPEQLREASPAAARTLAAAWDALGRAERELVRADRVEPAERAITVLAGRDSVPARRAAARLSAELALRAGRLADAERAARRDPSAAAARLRALVLIERGDVAAARAILAGDDALVAGGGGESGAAGADGESGAAGAAGESGAAGAAGESGAAGAAGGTCADALSARARLALAEGDYEAALGAAGAAGQPVPAALALAHLGRRDEAVAVADQAVAAARSPTDRAAAWHARCVAEPDSARRAELAAAALARFAGPAVLVRAALEVELGSALVRLGRRIEARGPLRAAFAAADAAGAVPLAERARRELVASGARPRRAAIEGPEALTPRQRQVCDLAAAGKTNRAIAHALFLSVKTVETHLARAYRTLGVPDRSSLAARLCAS